MPRRTPKKSTDQPGPPGPGSRVFAYGRDSRGKEQELSLSQQHAELERYAAERQWQIVQWWEDVRSGKSADNRTNFLAMIDACYEQPRPVDLVLTWALSRIGRKGGRPKKVSSEQAK